MNPSGPPTAFDSLEVAGVPTMGMGGIPTTFGNYWFVDGVYGSDGNTGDAANSAFRTIERAYEKMLTNNDDVMLIRGVSSTYNLDAMLDIDINRVHLVGLDGAWRPYGQGVKISLTALTGASNIATMRNTGVRNSFTNIKWMNASTVTEGIYCVVEGGEYAQYTNSEFYKSTDLDQTGAAEFVWNGDSTIMDNCTVGSLADPVSGAIVRAAILLTKGIAGSDKVCRDGLIRNTRVWRNCGNSANRLIYGANATDVERTLMLEHVALINNGVAAALPAQAISFGATLTVGQVILDPTCYAQNVTKVSTTTGVFVTGPASAATSGIPTQAA